MLNRDRTTCGLMTLFDRADEFLRNLTAEPIAQHRVDLWACRDWISAYERYCLAYRCLNALRIVRCIQYHRLPPCQCDLPLLRDLPSFRLRHAEPMPMMLIFMESTTRAVFLLDVVSRTILSSRRQTSRRRVVTTETNGTTLQTNRLRSAILPHSDRRRSWILERSVVFQPMERHTLKQRYEYLDLNDLLSGRRLRRVQRFGQSRGYDGTGIIPIGRMEASSRCSQFYPDFKEIVGKVTNGHQRVPPL